MSPDRNVPVVSTTVSASNARPICVTTPVDPVAFEQEVVDRLLEEREVRRLLEAAADRALVQHPVRLGAGRADRCALAGVEGPELDSGLVRGDRHGAAQRVDLLDQMALADAPDRRVAGHLPQRLDVVRQEQRAATRPGRRERRLGAGVPAADHDHVEPGWEVHV